MTFRKREPLVSVLMPTQNDSKYLVGALDSILNQTYENWELIAIDDGSVDSTYLILKHYALLDSRIKIFKNEKNIGVGATLDKAVAIANGEFIARMDGDDIAYPERFQKQVDFLLNNPEVVAVGGQVRMIDAKGKFIGYKTFPTDDKELYGMLYNAVPIQHPTLMVNTSHLPDDFEWYNGWPKAQDLYLFFKLVNYGKLANLEDCVLDYRYYSGGNSLKDPKHTFKLTREIREIGVNEFGYVPSTKAKIVNALQVAIVYMLPNRVIPTVFAIIRGYMNFVGLTPKQKLRFVRYELKKVPLATKKAFMSILM